MFRKLVATLTLTTLPMIALTSSIASANINQTKVTVFNQGGYVAEYEILYGQNKIKTPKLALGEQKTYTIPAGSQNVRVRGQAYTGLFWEPKRIIFDRNYTNPPAEICFKTYGTIFTSQIPWSNQCRGSF